MIARMLFGVVVMAFSLCHDVPAQDNATPKESTATLEKTLSWLGRHFETDFTYGYSTIDNSGDTAIARHFEASIRRSPVRFEDCSVSWRDRDELIGVSLSTIDPLSVAVLLHDEPNTRFDSDLWQLALLTRDGKKSITLQRGSEAIQSRNSVTLLFDDKENANRFARALQHAIKLCLEQAPPARE